jgi:hypothetical protein
MSITYEHYRSYPTSISAVYGNEDDANVFDEARDIALAHRCILVCAIITAEDFAQILL